MFVAMVAMGGDKTPDAVNWADIVDGDGTNANQTIAGISGSIVLHFDITQDVGSATFSYSKNGAGFAAFVDNDTLLVSRNDTLRFAVAGTGVSGSISVKNKSVGMVELDSFTYSLS